MQVNASKYLWPTQMSVAHIGKMNRFLPESRGAMNFTEIITSVATVCPIIIIAISIISIIYHYIRKTKQENDEKIMSAIYRHKLISDYCEDIDNAPRLTLPLYRKYKAMGGNGYLTQLYTPTEYKPKHISPHVHNCINCGAPLKKDQHSCEYCGTEYFQGGT